MRRFGHAHALRTPQSGAAAAAAAAKAKEVDSLRAAWTQC